MIRQHYHGERPGGSKPARSPAAAGQPSVLGPAVMMTRRRRLTKLHGMEGPGLRQPAGDGVLNLRQPPRRAIPLVVASPHSGADYSDEFLATSRLDPLTLRRSEDSFVDEIFAAAPDLGAPLIAARSPRADVDVNREAYELDARMFADAF